MNRKTITGLAVIVVLLGGASFWFFVARTPAGPEKKSLFSNLPLIGGRAPAGATTPPPGTGIKDAVSAHPVREIIDKDILAPTLSSDKKFLYYVLRENGHIARADLNGNGEEALTNLTVLETFDGQWSPKRTKALLWYHENGAVKKFLEETASTTPSRFLPQEISSFSWSPDGLSMAYLLPQNGETRLVVANENNKGPRAVFSTPVPDFTLSWVAKNLILLISRPSGLAPSVVMRLSLASQKADLLLGNLAGVVLVPTPDGSGFAYSQSGEGGTGEPLSFYTLKDRKAQAMTISTIAEKCVFAPDGKKLYCGVPKDFSAKPLPDKWYRGDVSFQDRIVEVDLATNQLATISDDALSVDLVSPFVSPDGKYLFFQDKKSGHLWRLTLDTETNSP